VTIPEAIEQIDIGGPSMLRAAAKNHRHVLPLCDPALYDDFLRELESGTIGDAFRLRCAIAVFQKTSAYDATIANFLTTASAPETQSEPSALDLRLQKFQDLRYGENPQQTAAFWMEKEAPRPFTQLQGKELSYNNLLDLDAAIRLAHAFDEPAAAVIKHTNPCGVARHGSLVEALKAAIESDPVSAFGGIIGANREFDDDAAATVESMFLEVIVAPSFSAGARERLAKKKNLRLVTAGAPQNAHELRSAAGGILMQSVDRVSREGWNVVTTRPPDERERNGLAFAWTVCAYVKSNAIVLTNESQSVGIGAGQMSRVDAANVAIMKAILPAAGCVAASDAFFPFRDGLDLLANAGITAVIQPGGSVRDAEVIAAANERGLAMIFTGERHFRH
jgi:phosphoribosylaminoimidazolecarboxamide formyltransferase/IMP cyclohydrolase